MNTLQGTNAGSVIVRDGSPVAATTPPATPPAVSPAQLVESCQGLVKSLAWKIHRKVPPQVELNDLIAYGQLGLVLAARDFDATRGGQFTTYAYYRIRGAILDGLSQMSWFSRAAYHQSRYERMSSQVLSENAEAESAAPPASASPSENASHGESELRGEVQWFADLASRLSVVYLASGPEGETGHGDVVDQDPTPPSEAIANEMRTKLAELIDALPAPARSLIRATYFEGVTMQEAGSRLGISKAWASRLHSRTLEQLARSLRRAERGSAGV